MIKRQLLCACAISALIGFAAPAAAQDTTADTTVDTTTQSQPIPPASADIVVTGSLIAGTAEDAALPVDVIGADELEKQGAPSVVDLVKALPTSSGVLGDSNQFDSRSQGAEGVATINLRGLGPERTLVLLNGQRLVTAPIGVPSVDLNLIPMAAIGRIEVLKDGAAATYGSDAVGGVVNFITNKRLEGVVVSGSYKFVRDSAGDYDGSIAWGHHGDGFRVLATFGYQHRSPLKATDRSFAVQPYTNNPAGGWTEGGNPTAFIPFYLGAPNPVLGGATAGATGGFQTDVGCVPLGGVALATGRCANNYSQFDFLVEKEDRLQAYLETEIDLTDRITFRASALYGHTDTHAGTSPSYIPLSDPSAQSKGPYAGIPYFVVPYYNPGLAAYRAANPGQFPYGATNALLPTGTFRVALLGGIGDLFGDVNGIEGSSPVKREGESIRFTSGLTFNVSDGLKIDVNGLYHYYSRERFQYDSVVDRIQLALRGFGGDNCNPATSAPGTNGCLFYNPFSNAIDSNPVTGATNPGYNSAVANSRDVLNYILKPSIAWDTNELFVGEVIASGHTGLSIMGGDNVGYAFGGQYRQFKYRGRYGSYNNLDIYPCTASLDFGVNSCARETGVFGFLGSQTPSSVTQNVYALFGEVDVPVGPDFNLQVAARYEDYGGQTGSTFDPKLTARWQVTDWLALRGSVGSTFRGPPANFLTAGDYVTSLQYIGGSFRAIRVNDNPALKPERATSYSAGVVVNSGGFRASVDYYRFDLRSRIIAEPVDGVIRNVFGTGYGGTSAADCSAVLINRFVFQGGPATGGCGTLANPTLASVTQIDTYYTNGSKLRSSGIDFSADYRGEFGSGVRFAVGGNATYAIESKTQDFIIGGTVIEAGFDAAGKLNYQTSAYPLPKWKGQAYAELSAGRHTGRFTYSYIDGYTDQRPPVYNIPSFQTLDFTYRAELPWDATLTLSVYNIFDAQPGFARLDYNYDPFTANPLGRQFKIGLTKKF